MHPRTLENVWFPRLWEAASLGTGLQSRRIRSAFQDGKLVNVVFRVGPALAHQELRRRIFSIEVNGLPALQRDHWLQRNDSRSSKL